MSEMIKCKVHGWVFSLFFAAVEVNRANALQSSLQCRGLFTLSIFRDHWSNKGQGKTRTWDRRV